MLSKIESVSGHKSPKEAILECRHKVIEECHDTYKTEFTPTQEERCTDRYQKDCKIVFNKQPIKATFKNCHTPLLKSCNNTQQGNASLTCETHFETACSSMYNMNGSIPDKENNLSETKWDLKILFSYNNRENIIFQMRETTNNSMWEILLIFRGRRGLSGRSGR